MKMKNLLRNKSVKFFGGFAAFAMLGASFIPSLVVANNNTTGSFTEPTKTSYSFNDYHFYKYPSGDNGQYSAGPWGQAGESYTPLWSRALKENGEYTIVNINPSDLPEKLAAKRRTIESNYYRTNENNLIAYCLDFGKLAPTGNTVQGGKVKNEVMNILKVGYPLKSGAEYGVKDIELEWATAVAIKIAQGGAYNSETGELVDAAGMTLDNFADGLSKDLSLFSYTYRDDYYADNVEFSAEQFAYMQNQGDNALNLVKTLLGHMNDQVAENTFTITSAENIEYKVLNDNEILYGPFNINSTYSGKNVMLSLGDDTTIENAQIVDKNGNEIASLTANDNGVNIDVYVKTTKTSGVIAIDGIVDGATELDNNMYVPNANNEQRMVVVADAPVTANAKANGTYVEPQKDVYKLTANIFKSDDKNQPLKDVEFSLIVVKDINLTTIVDNQYVEKTYKEGDVIASGKTDINGNVSLSTPDLSKPVNDVFVIVESKSLDGYISENKKYPLNFADTNELNQHIDINVINTPTEVTITKTDITNSKPVVGATIEIKNESGDVVYTDVTDSNGQIKAFALPVGNYTFTETIAPDGFIKTSESFKFSINKDGKVDGKTSFTNKPTEVVLRKLNIVDNTPLKGATIEIRNDKNQVVYTGETDSNGEIKVNYLPVGDYTYIETKAPDGFKLSEKVMKFHIDENGKVSGDLKLYNNPTMVKILKIDKISRKPLKGATIKIMNAETNKIVLEKETDEDGYVYMSGLSQGKYKFVEIKAPDGYSLSPVTFEFEIDSKGNVHGDQIIEDYPTEVVIKKLDFNTSKPLENAEIEIRNSQKEVVFKDITDKNGEVKVKYLPTGNYTFIETKAPDGYARISYEFKFTILPDGTIIGDTVITNKPIELVITKTDLTTAKPLPNATIEIRNNKNEVVHTSVTKEDGTIKVTHLPAGEYTFTEISAPDGYIKTNESFNFIINPDGTVSGTTSITNEATEVTIIKKDSVTGNPLKDAIIEVFNADDKLVFVGVTNDNGVLNIHGLPVGEYHYKEKVAPKGYDLSTKVSTFKILEDGTVNGDLELLNTKSEVPETPVKPEEPKQETPKPTESEKPTEPIDTSVSKSVINFGLIALVASGIIAVCVVKNKAKENKSENSSE